MANKDKFIDRSPAICPAGITEETEFTVKDCMQDYRLVDGIDTIKHELKIVDKKPFEYCLKKAPNTRHQGIYTESREALRPPDKDRYETVLNDLLDTSYLSYWNQEVGKTRDSNGMLPKGMDPETVTFGKPYVRDHGVKELINPDKRFFEVLMDSQEGHELYRKTHNDYNPGERVSRNYIQPSFDPNRRYGMNTIYDPKGIWVQCALTWHLDSPLKVVNSIQADYMLEKKSRLGKVLAPNENFKKVPKDFTYGLPCTREMCGVQELLKESCAPCRFKRDVYDWITHLNEIRSYVKRKRDTLVNLKDLYDSLRFHDKDKTGWLPIDIIYYLCTCQNLNFDHDKMEKLAKLVEILVDGKMNYHEFMTLIDVNKSCPRLMKIKDTKKGFEYYVTTNMAAARDRCFIDNSNMPVAGIPTIRMDISSPIVPEGQCRADLESLGFETTAGAVINPSIYTNYGLSHRDFLTPRTREYIKKLFEKVGYEFPGDSFEKLWKIGVDLDKTGSVCVDTFKMLVRKSTPPITIKKEETNKCS